MNTFKIIALFVVGTILAFVATSGVVFVLTDIGGAADLVISALLGFGSYKAFKAGARRARAATGPARDPQYDRDWSV